MLDPILNSPIADLTLRIAQIVGSSVVAITVIYTIKSYLKMRKTEQIKMAHEFFRDYRDLQKESARLKEQGKVKDERMDWAERYSNTIEWFSFLVNSKQITDSKIIGFYQEIVKSTYEKIVPFYYDKKQKEIEEGSLFPEMRKLYSSLKQG
jgi:alanyl-tRNA synthetase